MGIETSRGASRHLDTLFSAGTLGDRTDGQLLEIFLQGKPEGAAGAAFEVLIRRHGPMVLGVCRRALDDPHAADDAFQATFLVLVEKARAIRNRDSLASWLHGVALRVAAEARASAARRARHERRSAAMAAKPRAESGVPADLGADLHRELGRLPAKFREAVVLCHLEGLTHEEAAHRLALPVGTIRSRLARGRSRLRSLLERRGFGPVAGATLAPGVASPLAESLVFLTIRSALAVRDGATLAAGVVPASVVALQEGTMRSMLAIKILKTAAASATMLLAAAGALALARPDDPPPPQTPAQSRTAESPLPDRATVREALRSWWDSMETLSFRERYYPAHPDGSADRTRMARTFDYAHAPGDRRKVRHGLVNPEGEETYTQVRLDDGRTQYHVGGDGKYPPSLTFVYVRNQTNRGDRYAGEAGHTLWLMLFAPDNASEFRPLYRLIDEGAPLEITRDAGGKPRVILKLTRNETPVPVELDPDHGYLPKRVGGPLDITVTRFTRDNGVWFPEAGTAPTTPPGTGLQVFEVVDLLINRPLPAGTFEPLPEWGEKAMRVDQPGQFGPDSLERARANPNAAETFGTLLALVQNATPAIAAEALDLLAKGHSADPRINQATEFVAKYTDRLGVPSLGTFLRSVVARSPDPAIRRLATLHLARYLQQHGESRIQGSAFRLQELREPPDRRYYAPGPIDGVVEGPKEIAEAEALYETILADDAADPSLAATAREERANLRRLAIGRVAPEIEGPDLEGKPMALSDSRGKVVVLIFWGDWLPVGEDIFAKFRTLARTFEGSPVALLGVNTDPDAAIAAGVAREESFPGRSWFDGRIKGPLVTRWGVDLWPGVFVLDARGVIRFKNVMSRDVGTAVKGLLHEMEP